MTRDAAVVKRDVTAVRDAAVADKGDVVVLLLYLLLYLLSHRFFVLGGCFREFQ